MMFIVQTPNKKGYRKVIVSKNPDPKCGAARHQFWSATLQKSGNLNMLFQILITNVILQV